MSLEFPAELISEIVGNLEGDHDSLRACSLVAHQWLPSAHRVLFSTIHVRLRRVNSSLNSFIKLLRSSEAISHAIRRLCIKRYPARNLPYGYSVTSDQLFSVLRLLPCLHTLSLEEVEIGHAIPVMAEKESPCPSLSGLELKTVPVNSLGLYVVIASLPHLTNISFESPCFLSGQVDDSEDEDSDVSHHGQVSSEHGSELPVIIPPGVDPEILTSLRASFRYNYLDCFYVEGSGYSLAHQLVSEWGFRIRGLAFDLNSEPT